MIISIILKQSVIFYRDFMKNDSGNCIASKRAINYWTLPIGNESKNKIICQILWKSNSNDIYLNDKRQEIYYLLESTQKSMWNLIYFRELLCFIFMNGKLQLVLVVGKMN